MNIKLTSGILFVLLLTSGFCFTKNPFVESVNAATAGQIAVAQAKPAAVIVVSVISAYISWTFVDDSLPQVGLASPLLVTTSSFGSGFTVTPDGYIITNGHVVNAWNSELTRYSGLLLAYLQTLMQANLAAGSPWNFDYNQWLGWLVEDFVKPTSAYQVTVTNYQVNAYVGVGSVVSGLGNLGKLYSAQIVDARAAESWDLALLKVTKSNMPTVLLGNSDQLTTGQTIYSIGYPGVVVFHGFLNEEQTMEPSITSGIISAFRQTADGTPAIQTDAAITHGNSGGMAINEEGKVIGVATFGSLTAQGFEAPGFNFLRPSSLVQALLSANGVQNQQGSTDQLFHEGLELYWNQHYSAAIQKFQQVLNLFPGHPDAQSYITSAQGAIARGEDVPVGLDVWLWILAAAAIGVGVVVAALVVMVKRGFFSRQAPVAPPPQ
ncbi:MAG: trypsin-like peptidase domain-containing protein [Candidatus Bathyarchaeia archaeon]